MAVLSPTSLETTEYGLQGWNAVHTANMQKINTYLNKFTPLWNPATSLADGALLRYNATSKTWETVTGFSGTVTAGAQTLTYQGGVLISVA